MLLRTSLHIFPIEAALEEAFWKDYSFREFFNDREHFLERNQTFKESFSFKRELLEEETIPPNL